MVRRVVWCVCVNGPKAWPLRKHAAKRRGTQRKKGTQNTKNSTHTPTRARYIAARTCVHCNLKSSYDAAQRASAQNIKKATQRIGALPQNGTSMKTRHCQPHHSPRQFFGWVLPSFATRDAIAYRFEATLAFAYQGLARHTVRLPYSCHCALACFLVSAAMLVYSSHAT